MTWYLYTGRMVKPIPQGNGNVVAVQPNTKIEIYKITPVVSSMISKRMLRRTGEPQVDIQRESVSEKNQQAISREVLTKFSGAIKEIGVSRGGAPPVADEKLEDVQSVKKSKSGKLKSKKTQHGSEE